jgi:hypothetical protein
VHSLSLGTDLIFATSYHEILKEKKESGKDIVKESTKLSAFQ